MRRGVRKFHRLKVRRYTARFIDIDEYLDFFHGVNDLKWYDGAE